MKNSSERSKSGLTGTVHQENAWSNRTHPGSETVTFGELIKDLIREPLISDDKSVRASNKPESLSNIISMKSNTSFY